MKKLFTLSLTSMLILAACNDDSDADSEGNEETDDQSQEETTDSEVSNEKETEPEAEEILSEAASFYDDLDGLYFQSSGEVNIETGGEESEIPEADLTHSINESQWEFMTDDEYYNRLEVETTIEGEEEGETVYNEEPVTYQFTDLTDTSYLISYDEGDAEAVRYEGGTDEEDMNDLSAGSAQYELVLDEADEFNYVGEEEVNGYQTYHIEVVQNDEITKYWFDQDTYFEIKRETVQADSEESPDGAASDDIEILEYEVNPEFDESLFDAPEDIEVIDGSIEDTLNG